MISLIIPTTSANKSYTNNLVRSIKGLYEDNKEVEVLVEFSDTSNLCENYNKAVARAKGDKVILLHNDMVIKPGFVEIMDSDICKNRITTYTRIEPPIFNDTYPGKLILDCGYDLETFNQEKFDKVTLEYNLLSGGSQIFFGCMKEDYIGLDEKTFNAPAMWCSDDDLHLRYNLLGFEKVVSSAHVYHFVSKTSRSTPDYKLIEYNSNKNFIRKWGSSNRSNPVKYDIGIKVNGGTSVLLELLEPWCSNIILDDEMQVITSHYLDKEQRNTTVSLQEKIKSTPFESIENEIIVEVDQKTFNQQDLNYVQQLPEVIKDSGGIGKFQLGNLFIHIKKMNEYQNNLIRL